MKLVRDLRGIRAASFVLLALLTLVSLPGFAHAGPVTIGFRNDTKGPIIVQGMSVINNQLRQGRRLTIQPGATAWDIILAPGNKLIMVVDAKQPTRTLARETIQCGAKNLFFAIEVDEDPPANAKAKPKKTTKVKLTPATPPMTTSPMGSTGLPMRR